MPGSGCPRPSAKQHGVSQADIQQKPLQRCFLHPLRQQINSFEVALRLPQSLYIASGRLVIAVQWQFCSQAVLAKWQQVGNGVRCPEEWIMDQQLRLIAVAGQLKRSNFFMTQCVLYHLGTVTSQHARTHNSLTMVLYEFISALQHNDLLHTKRTLQLKKPMLCLNESDE